MRLPVCDLMRSMTRGVILMGMWIRRIGRCFGIISRGRFRRIVGMTGRGLRWSDAGVFEKVGGPDLMSLAHAYNVIHIVGWDYYQGV